MNDIEKRARELLAAEYRKCGSDQLAAAITNARSYVCDTEINAIIAALTPPEGYVLVPVEPTDAMRDVLLDMLTNCRTVTDSYGQLLAARPEVSP